jgi:hypothetical protein
MSTNWALPRTIDQYPEEGAELAHVSWQEIDNFNAIKNKDGKSIKTSRDLIHIARDPRHDIVEKTYFLRLTNFNFVNVPETITGIEAKISMNRFGRITDETIQLSLSNQLIGDNLANTILDPIKVYGGNDTSWNLNLTRSNILDSTFGIVLRFKSHPNWPHKTSALIDSVELRIH